MLQWFVSEDVPETTKKSRKYLFEEDVEVLPDLLPDAAIDENVNIHLIRKFFTKDAWMLIAEVVKQKQKNPVFSCKSCNHDLDEFPYISCDHCLSWSRSQDLNIGTVESVMIIPMSSVDFFKSCDLAYYNFFLVQLNHDL